MHVQMYAYTPARENGSSIPEPRLEPARDILVLLWSELRRLAGTRCGPSRCGPSCAVLFRAVHQRTAKGITSSCPLLARTLEQSEGSKRCVQWVSRSLFSSAPSRGLSYVLNWPSALHLAKAASPVMLSCPENSKKLTQGKKRPVDLP